MEPEIPRQAIELACELLNRGHLYLQFPDVSYND
jgi:hypothetical protein